MTSIAFVKRQELKTYEENLYCRCSEAMERHEAQFIEGKLEYRYQCPKCGNELFYGEPFPRMCYMPSTGAGLVPVEEATPKPEDG